MKSQHRLLFRMSNAQASRQITHTCASSRARMRQALIWSLKPFSDMQRRPPFKLRDAGLRRRKRESSKKRRQLKSCYPVSAPLSLRPRSSLTGIGSVKGNTPHSDAASTFEPSPGKNVKALPAPDQSKSFLENEYTVEFEDDSVRVAR